MTSTNPTERDTSGTASPKWNFDDATFERSATSFDNPDHVASAVQNYDVDTD